MVDTIKAYDTVAPIYSDYAQKRKNYIDAINELVLKQLQNKSSLLDVGSGDGHRLRKIMTHTQLKKVIAIEPSAEMAKRCRLNAQVEVIENTIDKIEDIGLFESITALWNVLGHVENKLRIASLKRMADCLTPEGIILLDVNNRHNAPAYGRVKVFMRRLVDFIAFDEIRGDCYYDWEIGEVKIPSYGHLFIHKEMLSLISAANLQVVYCCAVNYSSGVVSHSLTQGQLYFVLKKGCDL